MQQHAMSDRLVAAFDNALKTLTLKPTGTGRPSPAAGLPEPNLTTAERRHSAGLMRVNHAGEVAAQALYQGQALATSDWQHREVLLQAGREESDHLRWTAERLDALDSRPSLLAPLWYAGAFALGFVAGKMSQAIAMGFVSETEKQVEAHLKGHLATLPTNDQASRAIVATMADEEAAHGQAAREMGGRALPAPIEKAMRQSAKLMTKTAYLI
jgi:ubiquinone biosynthesis monooxygenase Coq7